MPETKRETFEVLISAKDQKEIIKLFEGSKKTPPMSVSKIIDFYSGKYTNARRQVMRVLHNNQKKTYARTSLV